MVIARRSALRNLIVNLSFIPAPDGCTQRAVLWELARNAERRSELPPSSAASRLDGNVPSVPLCEVCWSLNRNMLITNFWNFINFHRIQNLDSIVKPEDRDLPITNLRGDVLFNSWNSIFSAQGGFFSQAPRIYSFSGKNILSDPTWWVYEFLKGKFHSDVWQWLLQTVKRSLMGVENIYQLFCYLRLQWIFATASVASWSGVQQFRWG